jgi:hypothetical protein
MKHLIVIDDTGSPGNFNESLFLKENRQTLVAVFIHKEIRKDLETTIKNITNILSNEFNIKRLHFKDLINKNNEYNILKNDEVIFIMEQVSKLISQIPLPYLVQSCNSNTLKENGIHIQKGIKIDNLNLENNEDAALFLLIAKLKNFVNDNYPSEEIEIIMDQGRKSAGNTEVFKSLKGVSSNSEISYKSSTDFHLLQIADYFAYSINRMQTTAIKAKKTDLDIKILNLISIALQNQQSNGVSFIFGDPKKITKDDYDYEQIKQRQVDGNLNKWKRNRK